MSEGFANTSEWIENVNGLGTIAASAGRRCRDVEGLFDERRVLGACDDKENGGLGDKSQKVDHDDERLADRSGAVFGKDDLAKAGHDAETVHEENGAYDVTAGQHAEHEQAQTERVHALDHEHHHDVEDGGSLAIAEQAVRDRLHECEYVRDAHGSCD